MRLPVLGLSIEGRRFMASGNGLRADVWFNEPRASGNEYALSVKVSGHGDNAPCEMRDGPGVAKEVVTGGGVHQNYSSYPRCQAAS